MSAFLIACCRQTRTWAAVSAGLLLSATVMVGCGPKKPAGGPPAAGGGAKPATNAPPRGGTNAAAANLFQGEFVDDPKIGKDPFFPKSTRRAGPPPTVGAIPATTAVQPRQAPATNLVLKAILRTSSMQLATINRTTLEPGQEKPVKFPGGEVKVKLLEIKDRSVKVLIDGEPKELWLRRGNQ